MLVSFVLPLLAAFSLLSSALAQTTSGDDICNASHYVPFGCLSSHTLAASACKKLPRQTATLTVTTTTLDVNSITLTAHATSQTTVRKTNIQWSSKTVTQGPLQTVTTYQTSLKTETATTKTYIPNAHISAALAAPTCRPPKAATALTSLPPAILATACSCLGHPARTATVTSTITAPDVNTRTTDYVGTAPTTTLYDIVLSTTTLTVKPTKFVTATMTTCSTTTLTQSFAAPAFTQAFGPEAGCVDLSSTSGKILPKEVQGLKDATEACQELCAQEETCGAMYVQWMSNMRRYRPHWHCFLNEQKLVRERDLKCFPVKKDGIYGKAVGYDACGRGQEPLDL